MASAEAGGEATALGAVAPGAQPDWLKWLLLALWLPLALAAVAGPIAGLTMNLDSFLDAPDSRAGLWRPGTDFAPLSPEAKASGFRRGDTVMAVDGRSLEGIDPASYPAELSRLLDGPEASTVRITARSPDGTLSEHRLTRSKANVEAFFTEGPSRTLVEIFRIAVSFAGTLVMVAASTLLALKGGGRLVPAMLSFALLLICVAWYGGSLRDVPGLGWWGIFPLIGGWGLLIGAMMLFPDGRPTQRWIVWVAVPFCLVVVYDLGANALSLRMSLGGVVGRIVMLVGMLAAAVSLVLRYRSLPLGTERQQIRWAMFGFATAGALMVPLMVIELAFMPFAPNPSAWLWLSMLDRIVAVCLVGGVAGGLVVSLLRYRLYDADKVISRSVAYGTLTLLVLALFAGTERVIELWGHEYLGEELGLLAGGLGAAFAAAMIVPLHGRVSRWAERRFQKDLLRLRLVLPALLGDLRETAPLTRIAAATLDSVTHGVRASRAALLVDGTVVGARGIAVDEAEAWRLGWLAPAKDGLDADRADRLFPLRVPLDADGHGRVGWLLLGPRPDGSFYGKDERKALEDIADPVARALEIAAAREAREAAERDRWQGQESLNAELMRVLGSLDEKLRLLVPSPGTAAAE